MEAQEYKTKKEEVLSKFKKEFIEGSYLYDPTLHSIVELLIRGADPYSIIEDLIKNQNALYKRAEEKINVALPYHI